MIENKVAEHEAKVLDWVTRTNAPAAEAWVEGEKSKVRDIRAGTDFTDQERLSHYETQKRIEYDRELAAAATMIEIEGSLLEEEIDAEIARAEVLRSPADLHVQGTDKALLATIVDELQQQRVRTELAGLTRTRLLGRMSAWTDDTHNPYLRLIEAAVLSNTLGDLGIVDDGDHLRDGEANRALVEGAKTRRAARVPQALRDAKARLAKARTFGFDSGVQMLRKGYGIAARSRQIA